MTQIDCPSRVGLAYINPCVGLDVGIQLTLSLIPYHY
jgi:hypothetical protein